MKKQNLKSFLRKYAGDYAFIAPFYIPFLIFTIIPVVVSIGLSFTYFNVLEPPKWNGVSNYFQLFLDDDLFLLSLKNTLVLAIITGPLGYFLSLLVAWLICEMSRVMRTIYTIAFYVPSLCGGALSLWTIIFSGDSHGWINGFLLDLGIIYEPIQWLTDPSYMMPVGIIVTLWMSFGTGFLSFVAGFQNLDVSLFEAGAIDGIRNRWQEAWYITLPGMKPQLMISAVLSITGAFGIGPILTTLFGSPSTNYAMNTLVHLMDDYGNVRFEMGKASAIATLLFLCMIISNLVVNRALRKVGN